VWYVLKHGSNVMNRCRTSPSTSASVNQPTSQRTGMPIGAPRKRSNVAVLRHILMCRGSAISQCVAVLRHLVICRSSAVYHRRSADPEPMCRRTALEPARPTTVDEMRDIIESDCD
jgi:hypothetical protein